MHHERDIGDDPIDIEKASIGFAMRVMLTEREEARARRQTHVWYEIVKF